MKVEAALVEAVVTDGHGEPGALPLVSHALFGTWWFLGWLMQHRRLAGDDEALP
jgi:hypothetical protein